jgi:hypothetical protein
MFTEEAQKWYIENKTQFSVQKSCVISCSLKTNSTHLATILATFQFCVVCEKDLGVMLDPKLYLNLHVNYILPQAQELRGLIRSITNNFSSLNSLRIFASF